MEIHAIFVVLCSVAVSRAQLDLPSLPTPASFRRIPEKAAAGQSVFNSDSPSSIGGTDGRDDDDDDPGGRASDYDRDRSERYGPPYSLDNIDRVPAGPLTNVEQHNRVPIAESPRVLNYPEYPVVSNGARDHQQQSALFPNNGDNYQFFEGRPRTTNGDDDRYYQRPFRDEDKYYRPQQWGGGNNGYGGSSGGYGGGQRNYGNDDNRNGFYAGRDYGQGDHNGNRQPRPYDERTYNDRPAYNDDRYRHEQDRQNQFETAKLKQLLEKVDRQSSAECALNVRAQWDFETNVNEVTQINAVRYFVDLWIVI